MSIGQHPHSRHKPFEPWKFLVVFLAVFFLFSVLLFAIDFVPEASNATLPSAAPAASTTAASTATQFPVEEPVRIVVPAVGIDAPIENPTSTDVSVLDNALLSGAVRYPESGLLGDASRMYIFGHQSYLPIIHNQAFKTFNGLQNLKPGDDVIVYSATAAYHYRVASVAHVTVSTGTVELGGSDRMLTLTTCDSFGSKSDRYEVTARFVSRGLLTGNNT